MKTPKSKAGTHAPGRVSPTAPEFVSPSFRAWDEALSEPATREALDRGLAEVEAGETKPWHEVRSRVRSS